LWYNKNNKNDGLGRRTKKTVGNKTEQYYYNGDKLVAKKDGSGKYWYFLYDSTGVYAMCSQAKQYLFAKNMFGDVLGLYYLDGDQFECACTYSYDAWGVCTIDSDSQYLGIAEANPFRYRGYYYDSELDLYWLNTRHYDPKIGRFLTQDSLEYLDHENLGGLNLYSYCLNNPLKYVDPNGHFALLIAALIGGTIAAGTNILGQLVFEDASFASLDWWKVGISFASGFVSGLIPGSGVGSLAGQSLTSALVDKGLHSIILGNKFSLLEVLGFAAVQFVMGLASRGIASATSKATSKLFVKGNNYSQYQHFYRNEGFNYAREEMLEIMSSHVKQMNLANVVINYASYFIVDFLSCPLY